MRVHIYTYAHVSATAVSFTQLFLQPGMFLLFHFYICIHSPFTEKLLCKKLSKTNVYSQTLLCIYMDNLI